MRSRWRETLLLTSAAAWGVAVAITIATLFVADARPDQLPGNMASRNLDARGPLRGIEVLIVLPVAIAFAARRPVRRIVSDAEPWAVVAIAAALLIGLWVAVADPFDSIVILFVPPIAVSVLAWLRRRDLRFTSRDVILVPVGIAIFILLANVTPLSAPRLALLSAAVAMLGKVVAERLPEGRRAVVYAIFAVAFGLLFLPPGPPVVNLFEDGHALMPAQQMLHGALPYRDVVPGHGLIADGLLDLVAIKAGADPVRTRHVIAALTPAAVYVAALGVTGSADAAVLIFLLCASVIITGTPWARPVSAIAAMPGLRPIPSLLSLGAAAAAARLRSRRWLVIAAVLAVVAYFTSIEFGVYAAVACLVAAVLMREIRTAMIALAASAAVPLLVLLAIGVLPAFLRVTFIETPTLFDAYSIGFFFYPGAHGLPDILGGLFSPRSVWIILWFAVLIGTAAAIAARTRAHALVVAGCWTIAAALSFAERTNVYFLPVALIVAAAWARGKPVAILALAVIAAPTAELVRIAEAARHPVAPPAVRFRNVYVQPETVPRLQAAAEFIDRLGPDQTFVDFANMPILYYIFDKRAPLRQYETPFYESEALQREVIARLERDGNVRAALVQFPNEGVVSIDGVPNAARAPLVFAYLRTHFHPLFARNGVLFWGSDL